MVVHVTVDRPQVLPPDGGRPARGRPGQGGEGPRLEAQDHVRRARQGDGRRRHQDARDLARVVVLDTTRRALDLSRARESVAARARALSPPPSRGVGAARAGSRRGGRPPPSSRRPRPSTARRRTLWTSPSRLSALVDSPVRPTPELGSPGRTREMRGRSSPVMRREFVRQTGRVGRPRRRRGVAGESENASNRRVVGAAAEASAAARSLSRRPSDAQRNAQRNAPRRTQQHPPPLPSLPFLVSSLSAAAALVRRANGQCAAGVGGDEQTQTPTEGGPHLLSREESPVEQHKKHKKHKSARRRRCSSQGW